MWDYCQEFLIDGIKFSSYFLAFLLDKVSIDLSIKLLQNQKTRPQRDVPSGIDVVASITGYTTYLT